MALIIAAGQITIAEVADGEQGVPGIQGPTGQTLYTWVKYADDASGNGMSDLPDGKKYIGLAYNKTTPTESTSTADYAWSLIQGAQGIQGPSGTNGQTLYTWIRYADSPTSGMSSSPTNKKYMGIAYNKTSSTPSSTYSDYTWSLIQGPQGPTGATGAQGIQGPAGPTLYTWIKYADDETGSGMSDLPSGKKYIGLAYNKTTATESTTATDYTWSLIKGDQGIQGPEGADGQSLYTWVKYADSPISGMDDDPTYKKYMGIAYNKTSPTESTDYNDYSWSLIQGPQGTQGIQGPAGPTLYTWVKYADSSTGTNMSDSPTGKTYIGIAYNKTSATKSTNASDYTWSLFKGDQGIQGPAGANGQTYYTWLKYADSPTSGMSDDPTNKKYMGIAYNKTSATESTNYSDYSWSLIQGPTGATGAQGVPGPAGQSLYTWVKYADDASGNGMSDYPDGKTYIGLAYNKINDTESNIASDYTWSLIQGEEGIQGPAGADGQSLYTWVKYADSATTGMSDSPTNKSYMGIAYNKTTPTESTNYSDYSWSLIKGATGSTGATGKPFTWNLLKNAGLYKDTSGWSPATGVTRDTSFTNNGINSWKFAVTGLTSDSWRSDNPDRVPVSPGAIVSASVELYIPTTNNIDSQVALEIQYYNSSNARISTVTVNANKATVDKWQRLELNNKTVPANTTSMNARVWVQRNGTFWSSKLKLEFGTVSTEFSPHIDDTKGEKGESLYTWIKYADDATGSGMSDTPNGKAYIGIAYNKATPTESTTASDYEWNKIQGEDGVVVTEPLNPHVGQLWIRKNSDPSKPDELVRWDGTGWVQQSLSLEELDPVQYQRLVDMVTAMNGLADDGTLTVMERDYVQDKIIAMVGGVLAPNDSLPDMSTLMASNKGEVFSTKKQATAAGILSDDSSYVAVDTAYNNLRTYLNTLTPRPWDTTSSSSVVIDITNWRNLWNQYYNSLFVLSEATTGKLNGRITTIDQTYQNDITNPDTGLINRMDSAEQKIENGSIISTVMSSEEYRLSMDTKANADDLAGYASSSDLEQATNSINNSVDEKISGIDFSPYVTSTQLEQTSNQFNFQFRNSGGINLLKNSTGFANLDFWEITGTVNTIQNAELDVRGASSGFVFTGGTLSQTILVTSQIYTVSVIVKKGTAGTGYIKVYDSSQSFSVPLNANTDYDYVKYAINIVPIGEQITIELQGDADSGLIFTGAMVNVGSEPLQWQHAPGEIYNTNVLMDMNGIRVISSVYEGYTAITPEEFAGYAEVEGEMMKVFTLNKDVTEMTKAQVDSEIVMSPIKVIPIKTSSYNGWAFVPSDE